MHGNWIGGGCPFFGGFGYFGLWHILVLIGLVVVVVSLVMLFKNKTTRSESDALETLKMLYAKGEITEETYLSRKGVLERNEAEK